MRYRSFQFSFSILMPISTKHIWERKSVIMLSTTSI
ncbi:hypothetical protein ANCCAN_04502 [Ancylostoma caninum]|uniref:Uncharacterized protein n=1 Tax=Ancylostoma caninum TaxID=29170 RepID=A0A368H2E2_ANCCA|nr:hypothetical protein ANCCAN_04502 [Ancylostoma caninum]